MHRHAPNDSGLEHAPLQSPPMKYAFAEMVALSHKRPYSPPPAVVEEPAEGSMHALVLSLYRGGILRKVIATELGRSRAWVSFVLLKYGIRSRITAKACKVGRGRVAFPRTPRNGVSSNSAAPGTKANG